MKIIFRFVLITWLGNLTSCSGLLYYPTRTKYVDTKLLKYPPAEIIYYEDNKKNERLVGWYFEGESPAQTASNSKKKAATKKTSMFSAYINPKLLAKLNPETQKKLQPIANAQRSSSVTSGHTDKPLFIFFHGNAQNMSSHFFSLFWVLDHGYDFFIFDYPGYGASFGEPTPQNTVESGVRAIEYARTRWPQRKLIIFGQSLGGAISLKSVMDLKDRSNICSVVVESTFDSYKKVGQETLARSAWTWLFQPFAYILLSDTYAPKNQIHTLSPIPLLVIHRQGDPVVPLSLGERVFQQAAEPKQFLKLEGEGHVNAFTGDNKEQNKKDLLEFVQKSLKTCAP